jgi:hypothetical protein
MVDRPIEFVKKNMVSYSSHYQDSVLTFYSGQWDRNAMHRV